MTLLFPIGSFYPAQVGGPSNTLYWHVEALSDVNIKSIVITSNQGIKKKHDVEVNKWLYRKYGKIIYHSTKIHYFPLSLVKSVYENIDNCDVIHLTALFYPPSWIFAIIAVYKGIPVLWSVRGELEKRAMMYSKYRKKIILPLLRMLSKKKKLYFHATSDAEKDSILTYFGSQAQVFTLPNYLLLPELVEFSHTKEKYILFVGRVHPIKALDQMISALALSEKFIKEQIVFKIAGPCDEKYKEKLMTLISSCGLQDKVVFLGHVDGIYKQHLYADAFFTVLPSHSENFGNVVVESLAQGTPVLASKGTPWSILNTERAGMWVSNDIHELSDSITDFLEIDLVRYSEMRKKSLLLARNKFDVRANIHKWVDIYQNII